MGEIKKILLSLLLVLLTFVIVGCKENDEKVDAEQPKEEVDVEEQEVDKEAVDVVEKAELTVDEIKYVEMLSGLYSNLDDYVEEMNKIVSYVESDPTIIEEEDFNLLLSLKAGNFVTLVMYLKEVVKEEDVPERFKEIHSLSIDAFSTMSSASYKIVEGIEDGNNQDTINEGESMMEDGFEKVDQVLAILKEVQ
ncbi:hypothetical protein [Bacillus sp. FJAT-50079]|uniref:hypothetical protein n=1 Tax=Bacillus sp. FJAT-50079 TaxID=2833577 RepID=UPI001BC9E7B7|nr:hypothetical protein [Bacillus sp. FJAT-50079]MBS4207471.1 hypothetical protein [Bacillus sp. FJAT-50079]